MKEIKAIATFKINEGELNRFKQLCEQMIAIVEENDPGTTTYDWYLDEDNMECTVFETYVDSDAVLAHLTNVGEYLAELMEVSNLTIELYGSPNEELLKASESMHLKIVPYFAGL